MSFKLLDDTMAAMTTRKGAILAGVGAIALAGLLTIAQSWPISGGSPALAEENSQAAPTSGPPQTQFNTDQTQAIQQIVKDYLLKNPEILVEVSKELEQRQQTAQAAEQHKIILDQKPRIFTSPVDYVAGNPNGDITVVEFFDYNCAWCKRAIDEVVKLSKTDTKVRLVMKEFPIFGPDSTLAAKAAMASIRQGKYWEFHLAMMHEKQVTEANLYQIAARVGLDVPRLKADMADPKIEATLKETAQIAQSLNIEGTPGFIVDDKLNVGYLSADGLEALIGDSRKQGCKVC